MQYTDQQLIDLAIYKGLEDSNAGNLVAYGRGVLAGELAPPPVPDEVYRLMQVTDAWTADGWGHGVTGLDYWRSIIGWKGRQVRGAVLVEANVRASADAWIALSLPVEIAQEWQRDPLKNFGLHISLQSGSGTGIQVASRNHPDSSKHPYLLFGAGATDRVPAASDSTLFTSSAQTYGGKEVLSLTSSTSVVLRTERIPDNVTPDRALLMLYVVKAGTGIAVVRRLEPPVEFNVPHQESIYGHEGNYFESLAVGRYPTISAEEKLLHAQLANHIYKRVAWMEEDGEPFLRIYFDNRFRSGSFTIPVCQGYALKNASQVEGREVHMEFMCRVSPNFSRAVIEGGKWPGFASAGKDDGQKGWGATNANKTGSLFAGNGGGNVHGYDGWSARGGFYHNIRGDGHPALGYVPLHTYAYSLRQGNALYHELYKRYEAANNIAPGAGYTVSSTVLAQYLKTGEVMGAGATRTGHVYRWDWGAPSGLQVPGQWHRINQVMRINDPLLANGWLHAFVDGRQVGKITDVQWRSGEKPWPAASSLGIAQCWFNFYQGGLDAFRRMVEVAYIDVKRVAIRVHSWDQ